MGNKKGSKVNKLNKPLQTLHKYPQYTLLKAKDHGEKQSDNFGQYSLILLLFIQIIQFIKLTW